MGYKESLKEPQTTDDNSVFFQIEGLRLENHRGFHGVHSLFAANECRTRCQNRISHYTFEGTFLLLAKFANGEYK